MVTWIVLISKADQSCPSARTALLLSCFSAVARRGGAAYLFSGIPRCTNNKCLLLVVVLPRPLLCTSPIYRALVGTMSFRVTQTKNNTRGKSYCITRERRTDKNRDRGAKHIHLSNFCRLFRVSYDAKSSLFRYCF